MVLIIIAINLIIVLDEISKQQSISHNECSKNIYLMLLFWETDKQWLNFICIDKLIIRAALSLFCYYYSIAR